MYFTKRLNGTFYLNLRRCKGVRLLFKDSNAPRRRRERDRCKAKKLVLKVFSKFLQVYKRRFARSKKYLFILWTLLSPNNTAIYTNSSLKTRIISPQVSFTDCSEKRGAQIFMTFKPRDSYSDMDLILKHPGQVQWFPHLLFYRIQQILGIRELWNSWHF